jgi:hypothetical protein
MWHNYSYSMSGDFMALPSEQSLTGGLSSMPNSSGHSTRLSRSNLLSPQHIIHKQMVNQNV